MTQLSSWMQFNLLECFSFHLWIPKHSITGTWWLQAPSAVMCSPVPGHTCPWGHAVFLTILLLPHPQGCAPTGLFGFSPSAGTFLHLKPLFSCMRWERLAHRDLLLWLGQLKNQNLDFSGCRIGLFTERRWKQRECRNLIHWHRSSCI